MFWRAWDGDGACVCAVTAFRQEMTSKWGEVLAQARRASENEEQWQMAEEKRWQAGQALAAAVMEAAEAEQGRFAAERARQVSFLPAPNYSPDLPLLPSSRLLHASPLALCASRLTCLALASTHRLRRKFVCGSTARCWSKYHSCAMSRSKLCPASVLHRVCVCVCVVPAPSPRRSIRMKRTIAERQTGREFTKQRTLSLARTSDSERASRGSERASERAGGFRT